MMNKLTYVRFDDVDADQLLTVLNSDRVREHLIEHDLFTPESIRVWMEGKIQIDQTPGCKVRAVMLNNEIIGWCAIQFDDGKYELAIIIDDSSWGVGKSIYRDLISWSKALGHKLVYINLLYTRPQYRFLNKLAKSVDVVEMLGSSFTRYEIEVEGIGD